MNSVKAKHPIIICTLYFILFQSFTVKSVIPSLPSTCSLITRKQQKKGAESWIICVTVFYVLLMTTHNCAEGDFTVGLSTLKQVCPHWNGGAGRAALKPCDGQVVLRFEPTFEIILISRGLCLSSPKKVSWVILSVQPILLGHSCWCYCDKAHTSFLD